jgi:hypothetical protein
MNEHLVPVFADALRAYLPDSQELSDICGLFDTPVERDFPEGKPHYFDLAKRLLTQMEHANNRRTLDAILQMVLLRCSEGMAKTTFERQDFHREMERRLQSLRPLLEGEHTPTDIAVTDGKPFTAKSEIRDLVAKAEGELLLVDAYVGAGTLDCLRPVEHPIRILTGQNSNSIEPGFETAVKEFRAEGRKVSVRRHQKLHDRYLIFNERCWLVGSSIKDAGKKSLNVIECVDTKQLMVDDAEKKWNEGTQFL